MALNLGELTVQLSYVDQISKWSREFSSSLNTVEKRLNKFAETAQKAAVKAGVALGGLTLVTRKLIDAASDAVELQNVMEQAFGSMADEMNQWATETAQAVGRSDYQIRQFVGTTQALLAPMLENREAAAEMSKQVAQLAVDLGSFWNVADDDALQALKSGLAGETEPLRRFGVNLLESNLQLEAQRLGIKKSVSEMTQAEKVQLRWAIILRQTRDAQGDAIRTADSYANQVKRLQGNLHNLAEEVGSAVVPYANRFVHELNTLLSRFHDLDWQTKEQIVRIGALAAAVLGGVVAFGAIASGVAVAVKALGILSAVVGIATSPWLLLAGVVLVALAGMVGAWDKYGDEIGAKADAVWQKIKPIYDLLAERVSVAWQWTVEAAGNAYEWVRDTAISLVGTTVSTAWQWTITTAGAAYEWMRDNGPKWINQTVRTTWEWAIEGYDTVKAAVEQAVAWADKTVTTTWNWTTDGLEAVKAATSHAATWADQTLTTAWDWTVSGITNLPEFFTQAKQWAGVQISTVWAWTITPTVDTLREWMAGLGESLDSAAERVRSFKWPEMDKLEFEIPAFNWPEKLPDLPANWKDDVEKALEGWVPRLTISQAVAQITQVVAQYQDGTISLGEAVQQAVTTEVGVSLGALAALALPLPWPLKVLVAAVSLVPAEYLSLEGIQNLAQTVWQRINQWFADWFGGGTIQHAIEAAAAKVQVPVDILGAIMTAEGSDKWLMGVKSVSAELKAEVDKLTQELFGGVFEQTAPEFQIAAAALSMRNYWDRFAQVNVEAARTSFKDASLDLKEEFLRWVSQFWAPTEGPGLSTADLQLNPNWPKNAVAGLRNWANGPRFQQAMGQAQRFITVTVPVKIQPALDWAQNTITDTIVPALKSLRDQAQQWLDSVATGGNTAAYAEYGVLYIRYRIAPILGLALTASKEVVSQVAPLAQSLDQAIGRVLDLGGNQEFDLADIWSGIKLALYTTLVELPDYMKDVIQQENLVGALEEVWNSNVAKVIKLAVLAKIGWEALEDQLAEMKKALLQSNTYKAVVNSLGLKVAILGTIAWELAPTEFKQKVVDFLNQALGTKFNPDDFVVELGVAVALGVATQAAVSAGQSLAKWLTDAVIKQLAAGGAAAGVLSAILSNGVITITLATALSFAIWDIFFAKKPGEQLYGELQRLEKELASYQQQMATHQKTLSLAKKAGDKAVISATEELINSLNQTISEAQNQIAYLQGRISQGTLRMMSGMVAMLPQNKEFKSLALQTGQPIPKAPTTWGELLGQAFTKVGFDPVRKTWDDMLSDLQDAGYTVSQQFVEAFDYIFKNLRSGAWGVVQKASKELKLDIQTMFAQPEQFKRFIDWLNKAAAATKDAGLKQQYQSLAAAFQALYQPPLYAEGGFTGAGGVNQPAGIVHAGEWVAPAWMLKRYPWLFGRLEDIRKRGYQQGGPVATSVPKVTTGNPQLDRQLAETTTWLSALEDSLGQITDTIVTGFKQLFGWLGDLLVGLAERLFPEQMASLREFWSGMQDTLDRLFGPLTPEEKGLVEQTTAVEPLATVPEVPPTPRFTELVWQWVKGLPDAVKTGITHLRDWGKGVLESTRQLRDWRKTLADLDKAAGAMAIKLGEIAKQTGRNLWDRALAEMPILQNAMQAYAEAGGGIPGIAAGLTSLIADSETFRNLLDVINPILQAFADALGKILEPLLPLVEIVSNVLSPAFQLLGTILSAVFTPILQAMFPILKMFGLAVLYINRALAWLYNAIANTINKLLGWLGVHLNTIDLKQFDDAIKQLTETTWDSAMARAKEKKAIDSVASALRNVPQGFKVALERFRAAVGEPLAGAQVAWPTSTGGNVTVIIEGDVYGMDDFERRVQTAVASAQRRNSIGRFGLATGGAQ